ncbi:MAG: 23S rRNA (pseudouridine(1915)-N(3))-methyltransferase RlmH [Candidatus Saccharibacteria bacterium]
MPIRIIAIGKKHESWVEEGIERYRKRLRPPFLVEWVFLPHSLLPGPMARREESQRIISKLNTNDFVILLDERGKMVNSNDLAKLLQSKFICSCEPVIVIGGAYGVDDSVRRRANFTWSLSDLVFPHQLVRLILIEQLYRAQEIISGGPYHHE